MNPDCVRDILLTVEEHCDFNTEWCYEQNNPSDERLNKYSNDEVRYHIRQCGYADLLIVEASQYINGDLIVKDLAPAGHKFLENMRQDTIWNNTKSIASKIGSKSLDALVQISSNVITELIKAQFGLTGA